MSRATGAKAIAVNPEAAKSKIIKYPGTAGGKSKNTITNSNTI